MMHGQSHGQPAWAKCGTRNRNNMKGIDMGGLLKAATFGNPLLEHSLKKANIMSDPGNKPVEYVNGVPVETERMAKARRLASAASAGLAGGATSFDNKTDNTGL